MIDFGADSKLDLRLIIHTNLIYDIYIYKLMQSPNYWQSQNYQQSPNYQQSQDYQQSQNYQQSPNDQQSNNFGRRRCRWVCDNDDEPQNPNLRAIARRILNTPLNYAYRIYRNIRVVIRDGQNLPSTRDYDPWRINVETRNNIIIRIVSFG